LDKEQVEWEGLTNLETAMTFLYISADIPPMYMRLFLFDRTAYKAVHKTIPLITQEFLLYIVLWVSELEDGILEQMALIDPLIRMEKDIKKREPDWSAPT
jgi:hypothetical protein